MAELTLEQQKAVVLARARLRAQQASTARRGSLSPAEVSARQAELTKAGRIGPQYANPKGVDTADTGDSSLGGGTTAFLGGLHKGTALIDLGRLGQNIRGIPSMLYGMVDPQNSALQAAAARQRGDASPDPYNLLPMVDEAVKNKGRATVGLAADMGGQVAGGLLTSEGIGRGAGLAMDAGEALVNSPAGSNFRQARAEGLMQRATRNRELAAGRNPNVIPDNPYTGKGGRNPQAPTPGGLGGVADDVAAGAAGYALGGRPGMALGELINLARQAGPLRRGLASAEEAIATRIAPGMPETGPVRPFGLEAKPAIPWQGEPVAPEPAGMFTPKDLVLPQGPGRRRTRRGSKQPLEGQPPRVMSGETYAQRQSNLLPNESDLARQMNEMAARARVQEQVQAAKAAEQARAAAKAAKEGPFDSAKLNKWMNVPSKQVAHGANPGRRILDEGLLAQTKEATRANVESALETAGKQMEAALKKSAEIIDGDTLVQSELAATKKRIGAPKDAAFVSSIDAIRDDILAKAPNLDSMTPLQAHRLKVEIGDAIKWTGEASGTPVNQALIRIYRGLNGKIKSAVEGIGDLQDRWGDLYVGAKSLKGSMDKDLVGRGTGRLIPPSAADLLKNKGVSANGK